MRSEVNGGRTGFPPGLLQDDSRSLSRWFASRLDARRVVREVCREMQEGLHKQCPPCHNDCRQGRDCPSGGSVG